MVVLFRLAHKRTAPLRTLYFLLVALILLSGCKQKPGEVDDPQLKPIQELLQTNLPIGTPDATVSHFLAVRGYPTETSQKPGTIVATIRHIDRQTMKPVTARVTFYFDANGKLNTYEIVRTFNAPIPH
jgi:hypothetical protein